jgi:glutamate synthase domain-containing protein 3
MTGGRVVVIGPTGRNFAAGMSGGIAYVYDDSGQFPALCNKDMVSLETPDQPEDVATIQRLLENHLKFTGSPVAKAILDDWEKERRYFVKVIPNDYKKVLANLAEIESRAAALSRKQTGGNGEAAGAEKLVTAGVKKGGSDVGEGNH